ncbi:universal stress protein [Hymenobacter lutimineralis]|uniref:Universal stress protein n=1 Tax=Hymenobacter lutimineralis TaxID=2606448 RepID=A0A5D6V1B3_9BACT|nr:MULTISPECIES: universal stress protein [Hymenobacter]QIX61726.1 universal stress protein [Hymenobacter sp. BT18]TYZ09270.1 universal stress protein [Hymenobacter lutimineralis]
MHLSKILCPLDFSGAAVPLLAYAAAMAEATGAELCLLHVQEPQLALNGSMPVPDAALELARYRLLAEQAGARRVTTQLCQGDADREIVRVAQRSGADLIVIGSHGHTGLTRFLMGNTAEHVVRHAPCATLLVKPHGDAAYRQSA